MNSIIQQLRVQGAIFCTPNIKGWLLNAYFDENQKNLEVIYLPLQANKKTDFIPKTSKWTISIWDFDTKTQKLYAAFSQADYVQIKAISFDKIKTNRLQLEQSYLYLTQEYLPHLAQQAPNKWIITEGHCFQRVLLDHVFQSVWYDHIPPQKRPAYKQLNNQQLSEAILMAYELSLENITLVQKLQQQSLRFRGHRKQV
jgi:hypothetical protein